jgi:lipoprotein-anchoring transpeptidase ErfK/SrfK
VPTAIRLLLAVGVASSWVGAAHAAPTQRSQPLVVVLARQPVRATSDSSAHAVGAVNPTTPITRIATVLPVLQARAGWIQISLPGRPNGHSGWIRSSSTRATETPWRLTVDLSQRRVTVFNLGKAVQTFSAVIGKPSTPTPVGRFFVEEPVRLGSNGVGGPYALALSARSNVLQEFDGGPGQIAIHGRDNIGGTLGAAESHGCIRLADRAIIWLVGRVDAGTPVTITP